MELDPAQRSAIAREILSFPCFADASKIGSPERLIGLVSEAYEQDNLTEEQDLALEAVLYLAGLTTEFNLLRALDVWGADDYDAFRGILDGAHRKRLPPA